MKAAIGRKIGMTQIFSPKGEHTPITLVQVVPNYVTATAKNAQGTLLATIGVKTRKRASKPLSGFLKKVGINEVLTKFKEFPADQDIKVGQKIDLTEFQAGDKITIAGLTKGKGFAGTIKRHGFSRGPASHGSNNIRQPGSIGAQQPQRVIKGRRMSGHMGVQKRTVKNLQVIEVDGENNLLAIKGSVPGPNKGWLYLNKISNG